MISELLPYAAYVWQTDLYVELLENRIRPAIDIPTGLGKTSVMAIWLTALAEQARRGKVTLPRRLVWVVDRRVVVDQATVEAESLREKVQELTDIRQALCALSGDEPLSISTLRGERADDRLWSDNPARPAIIIGTVDMIGSRLLFSGYGLSRRLRARQAGLLAYDTLLVNDEAHLTPVFASLVDQVEATVVRNSHFPPPIRLLRLSATQRGTGTQERFPASLDADESASGVFRNRYRAEKRLDLIDSDDTTMIEKLALTSKGRTIVFVSSPEKAEKLAATILKKKKQAVPLITGQLRGFERDRMVRRPEFAVLTRDEKPDGDHWLVANSAGEVGVNLTCDHLITELAAADHMLQRFGRLNRFGETQGVATVVCGSKKLSDQQIATRQYLETLNGDVSPHNLRENPPPFDAISPEPRRAPLLPWHVDVWSMTSLTEKEWPSRPEVGPWLRGEEEEALPETYVCWRTEIDDLAQPGVSADELQGAFQRFRILAQERLKQRTDRLCDALDNPLHHDRRVLLVRRDGEVEAQTIGTLLERTRRPSLHYATLVLPLGMGALSENGSIDWGRNAPEKLDDYDVSTEPKTEGAEKRREKEKVEADVEKGPPEGMKERCRVSIRGDNPDADERASWRYYTQTPNKVPAEEQPLNKHLDEAAKQARALAEKLFASGARIGELLGWAAERHDLGKRTLTWQRYARNPYLEELDADFTTVIPQEHAIAKSKKFLHPRALGGYRHELGSLLDALGDEAGDLGDEERDLALHLIASHHGFSRPHFPANAVDNNRVLLSEEASAEAARRFARLQRRYGPWGLAYLEAVFAAADAIASRNAPENPADD